MRRPRFVCELHKHRHSFSSSEPHPVSQAVQDDRADRTPEVSKSQLSRIIKEVKSEESLRLVWAHHRAHMDPLHLDLTLTKVRELADLGSPSKELVRLFESLMARAMESEPNELGGRLVIDAFLTAARISYDGAAGLTPRVEDAVHKASTALRPASIGNLLRGYGLCLVRPSATTLKIVQAAIVAHAAHFHLNEIVDVLYGLSAVGAAKDFHEARVSLQPALSHALAQHVPPSSVPPRLVAELLWSVAHVKDAGLPKEDGESDRERFAWLASDLYS